MFPAYDEKEIVKLEKVEVEKVNEMIHEEKIKNLNFEV